MAHFIHTDQAQSLLMILPLIGLSMLFYDTHELLRNPWNVHVYRFVR